MKNIPLRDFQLKPTEYLTDTSALPIGLTRYGKVVAVLSAPTDAPEVVKAKAFVEKVAKPFHAGFTAEEVTHADWSKPEKLTTCPHGKFFRENCPLCT